MRLRPDDELLTTVKLLVLVALCAGCDDGDRPRKGRWLAAFVEIESRRPVPVRSAVAEMRIDGHEHVLVPIHAAGRPGGGFALQVANNGTIALNQLQDARIRIFNARGDSIGSVGRRGAGPGEFIRPNRLGWIGDTLWVEDGDLARTTLISPNWKIARTLPPLHRAYPSSGDAETLPEFPFVFTRALYGDETILASVIPAAGRYPASYDSERHPYVRVTREGLILRIIAREEPNEGSVSGVSRSPTGERVLWSASVPFFPNPDMEVSPDGLRLASVFTRFDGKESGAVQLAFMDADGDTLFRRAYPFDGERIPEDVADSAIAERMKPGPGRRVQLMQLPEARRLYKWEARRRMPKIYPPVIGLFIANDHRIWLALRRTGEGNPWLILDERGDPAGTTVVPANVVLLAAQGWQAWGVERDELDVQSVIRYRFEARR
jgi:hypothetical protein